MRTSLTLLIAVLFFVTAHAQSTNQMVTAAESDPQAKAVLDKMRAKYEKYNTLQADFDLTLKFPDQPEEVQAISIRQSGNKYRLEMDGRTVISDGTSIWIILHNNKEIQINNAPEPGEDAGIMSPQSLFRIYESNEFVYVLTNETKEDGRAVQQIEFKPVDTFSDYSKLRMTLHKDDASFKRIKSFGKDGSLFTLSLKSFTPNTNIKDSVFTFNPNDYPGYYVEDLR